MAVMILLASPLIWDLHASSVWTNHIFSLFCGQPPYTYFPIFPWLVYPLTGFAIGVGINGKLKKLFRDLLMVGTSVFLFEYLTQFTNYNFPKSSFYRTYPDVTLMHLGFAVAWFAMWHFISKKSPGNKLFSLFVFLSKNITLIYVIQWVLIFWCFPLFGYHRLPLAKSVIVSFSASAITIFITYFSTHLFRQNQQQFLTTKNNCSYYES
jgi:uncharacterized membrane protein